MEKNFKRNPNTILMSVLENNPKVDDRNTAKPND